MVLQIIVIKFSCILNTMSRNTFPDPQPDSASCIEMLVLHFSNNPDLCGHVGKLLSRPTSSLFPSASASSCSSRPSWPVSLYRLQSGIVWWYKEPASPFSETVLTVTSDQYCVRGEVQVYTSAVLAAFITSTRPRPCFLAPAPVAASWSPTWLLPGTCRCPAWLAVVGWCRCRR